MRLDNDAPARQVEFIYRGDGTVDMPFEVRPTTLIRSVLAGVVSTPIWFAAWLVPALLAQPGPVGWLLAAFIAVLFATLTAVQVGRLMGQYDTTTKPLRHNLRRISDETRAERVRPADDIDADTDFLWNTPDIDAGDTSQFFNRH